MKRLSLIAIVLMYCLPGLLSADSIWFMNGYNGYSGSVDTYLASSAPTTNYSTDIKLWIRSVTTPLKNSLVKFESLNLPDNAVITKAQLRVYVNAVYQSAGVAQVWAMQKNWEATTATWNTTDGSTSWTTAGALGTEDRGSAAIAELAVDSSGYKTFDLPTSLVQSWIDSPSTNYGIQLASVSDEGLELTSNEITWGVSYRPGLYIEYEIVPEPASLGLVLVGSLGFLLKNYKRK